MSKKQSASWRIVLRSLTNNNFPSSLSATDGQASFSLPHSETKFLLLGFGGKFFFGKEKSGFVFLTGAAKTSFV